MTLRDVYDKYKEKQRKLYSLQEEVKQARREVRQAEKAIRDWRPPTDEPTLETEEKMTLREVFNILGAKRLKFYNLQDDVKEARRELRQAEKTLCDWQPPTDEPTLETEEEE